MKITFIENYLYSCALDRLTVNISLAVTAVRASCLLRVNEDKLLLTIYCALKAVIMSLSVSEVKAKNR